VLVAMAALLGMLYLGRTLLVPVTMAFVLSFALSPVVRSLRGLGLGQALSVFGAVACVAAAFGLLVVLMGIQVERVAESLPVYRGTLEANMRHLKAVASPDLGAWVDADGMFGAQDDDALSIPAIPPLDAQPRLAAIPVEIRPIPISVSERLRRIAAWASGPASSIGIVFVVLVFVLLEQEALRDRFVRLVGGADLRSTTTAINEAGERLSRYLMRQFAVNAGVGAAVWAALACIGVPDALLIAPLVAVLRFVPFLGMPIAAIIAGLLALASTPGWEPTAMTLGAILSIQVVTSQLIEPRVYGHATGLSPLCIVLATLFWGWLWGPVGVVISTPLTLSLAVAGRHAASLRYLDVLLGDGAALTMAQKFYQRALSADVVEILRGARTFLKRRPFAAYCDTVLIPALQLALVDFDTGDITVDQQARVREAIVHVVEGLDGAAGARASRKPFATMLDKASAGALLRERRMLRQRSRAAHQMTPDDIPGDTAPLVPCIALGAIGDDLATELLVRMLRGIDIDARHLTLDDLNTPRSADVPIPAIGVVCLVSMTAGPWRDEGIRLARRIRASQPQASLMALLLPGMSAAQSVSPLGEVVDLAVGSFEDATREFQAGRALG
jgi:predicted PurR-regulated permease PerM